MKLQAAVRGVVGYGPTTVKFRSRGANGKQARVSISPTGRPPYAFRLGTVIARVRSTRGNPVPHARDCFASARNDNGVPSPFLAQDGLTMADDRSDIRPGEVKTALPERFDASLY